MHYTPPYVVVFGYVIAVLASASFVTLAFLIMSSGSGGFQGQWPGFLMPMFILSGIFIFMTAFPGYALTVYLAGKCSMHSPVFYVICGGANAALAHLLLWIVVGGGFGDWQLLPTLSIFAGAFGGWAYYMFRDRMLNIV